ncbi:MAG: UPF0149 family protein [Candidatus Competibacteraceae bacterium]|nr:UPF0149 family protein [Candidatus Competibacteraceae bacterium]
MNESAHLPGFERIDRILARIGNPADPAEVHGLLCGVVCTRGVEGRQLWLEQVLEEGDRDRRPSPEDRNGLLALYDTTLRQLDSDEVSLRLMLPSDDEPLDVRAEALGLWCQGFVSGLGTGLGGQAGLSPEGEEFLRDLSEISRVGFDADSTDEADETAYAEIVEYVRVGVVLMGEELRPRPVTRAPRIH